MKFLLRPLMVTAAALIGAVSLASAQGRPADIAGEVDAVYPQADALYRELHRQPELSGHAQKTAAKLADGLRTSSMACRSRRRQAWTTPARRAPRTTTASTSG
jgi:hypothetical protein